MFTLLLSALGVGGSSASVCLAVSDVPSGGWIGLRSWEFDFIFA